MKHKSSGRSLMLLFLMIVLQAVSCTFVFAQPNSLPTSGKVGIGTTNAVSHLSIQDSLGSKAGSM